MCLVLDNFEDSFSITTFNMIPDVLLEWGVRRNEIEKLHEASWLAEVINFREVDLNLEICGHSRFFFVTSIGTPSIIAA